ncbi:MAG: transcription antitermination factor NusB [Oscillospiraceae bacterium]|nr:transcription antitermination factor NusB [Oscillospiraceae bacterium]
MTRGNARELAIHLIYGREFTGDTPADVIRIRLEEGYYENLAAEYEIYTDRPSFKQVKYLERIVSGVHEHEAELNDIIGKFSIGWDVKRISRLNRVIMQLAVYEILYVDDVPEGVAVSEAVRIAKKYDEEMGPFVNGILGAFVRSRKEAPAESEET